jgi:hypothetical protein
MLAPHDAGLTRCWPHTMLAPHDAGLTRCAVCAVPEFFLWTLTKSLLRRGGKESFEAVFRAFDKDRSGYLDEAEFASKCLTYQHLT